LRKGSEEKKGKGTQEEGGTYATIQNTAPRKRFELIQLVWGSFSEGKGWKKKNAEGERKGNSTPPAAARN